MPLAAVTALPSVQRRAVRFACALIQEVGIPDGPGQVLIPEQADDIANRHRLPVLAVRALFDALGPIVDHSPAGYSVDLDGLAASPGAEGLSTRLHRTVPA